MSNTGPDGGGSPAAAAGYAPKPPKSHAAPILRLGAKGEWVKTLQEMLGLPDDGVFGRGTLSALAHFQHTHGLHPNGETDAQTWNLLGTSAPASYDPGQGKFASGGSAKMPGTVSAQDWQLVRKIAKQHGIDPYLLVSIGMHETGWGTQGAGRQGYTLGVGVPDSGGLQTQYQGLQNQLQEAATILDKNGVHTIQDIAAGKLAPVNGQVKYASDPNWSNAVVQQYDNLKGTDFSANTTTPSSASSTSTGAANVPGAAAGNAEFSKKDLSAELDNLGLPKALINGDKGLQAVFQQLVKDQIDLSTPAGQDRAMTLFKNTKWWKARSDSQRKFDVMKADNPGEFSLSMGAKQKDLQAAAASMGIPLNGGDLQSLTQLVLRNGLDETATRQALAQHFAYNPGGKYTGETGLDIAGIQQMAASQYQNVSDSTLNSLVDNLLANNMNPQSLQDYFKELAVSKFPHLQKQLEAGQTVADIADPYKQQMAQRLEVDPNGIKNEDPTVMKALQQPTGKGDFQLMPLWQYDQMLKQDPRWMQTNNARDSLVDMGTGLLRNLGLTP